MKSKQIQNQPEVDEEFINEWYPKLNWLPCNKESEEEFRENMKQMLQEAGYNVVKKPEITMKDIQGWADEIRERVTNHKDWSYLADGMKDMVEEEFGIKVKK